MKIVSSCVALSLALGLVDAGHLRETPGAEDTKRDLHYVPEERSYEYEERTHERPDVHTRDVGYDQYGYEERANNGRNHYGEPSGRVHYSQPRSGHGQYGYEERTNNGRHYYGEPTGRVQHHSQARSGSSAEITSVRCIKPSLGTYDWVDDQWSLYMQLEAAVAGLMVCGASVGLGCLGTGVAGVVVNRYSDAVAEAGVELISDFFSGSDDLYIKVHGGNGDQRYPSNAASYVGIESQERIYPGLRIDFGDFNQICLFEYDVISSDDDLGCVNNLEQLPLGRNVMLVKYESEGSVYEVEINVS